MTRNRAIFYSGKFLRLPADPYEIIMLNVLRFITSRCNKTNATTVGSVLEIPTSGPAKGLHGLDSHSGISVAAVINVHECRFRVITAHARSPGFCQCHIRPVFFFLFIFRYRILVVSRLSMSLGTRKSVVRDEII